MAQRRHDVWSNQKVEDAKTEQIERDADVTEVVETRQHANAKAATQSAYSRSSTHQMPTQLHEFMKTDARACFSVGYRNQYGL